MEKPRKYVARFIDDWLKSRLSSVGAVLLRGPKGCGKTFSAQQVAASEIFIDTDPRAAGFMAVDPSLVLRGEPPRLLDEWQVYPELWNYVRREVDARQKKGQFILTGSATPVLDAKTHSGVGRFSVIKMRTLSRAELGFSNAQVSLADLLTPDLPISLSSLPEQNYTIDEVVRQLIQGGWPGLIAATSEEAAAFQQDYITLTAEVDVNRVDGVKRDPSKMLRLVRSYARNIATQASIASIAEDTKGDDAGFSPATAHSYIEVLEKLMIIEELPAWNTHLRSTVALRTTPKRHFADPSLAIGALRLSAGDLLNDLEYTGFLFESSVIRDLRVYADAVGAEVGFFRDAKGREVDAIVQKADGSWAGFEIKLGDRRVDEGAEALLKMTEALDLERVGRPSSLNVITSSGFPYRRADGINVIPVSTLTA